MLIAAFFRTLFLQAFDFSGRSTRTWIYLYSFLNAVFLILIAFLSKSTLVKISYLAFNMLGIVDYIKTALMTFSVLSSVSIMVRRLHDVDKRGWFIFLFLIPVIGPFFAFIFLFPGTEGRNRFGVDPRTISRLM